MFVWSGWTHQGAWEKERDHRFSRVRPHDRSRVRSRSARRGRKTYRCPSGENTVIALSYFADIFCSRPQVSSPVSLFPRSSSPAAATSSHHSNGMGGGAVALLRKLLKWGPQLELRRRIGFFMVVCGRIGNGKDRLKSENTGHLLRPRVAPTSGPQAISPRLARGRPSPLPHPARAPSTCPPLLQKFQSELALRVPRERQVGPQPLYDLFHRQILWQRPFDHLAGG